MLNKYDMIIEQKSRFIEPIKEGSSFVVLYVSDSKLFSLRHETQQSVGHGGNDHMIKVMSMKYKNGI